MKYDVKSVIFGRKPRVEEDEFKTAFFKLYETEDPFGPEGFPLKELDFRDIEKIEIKSEITYYLEGNDLVFKNIKSLNVEQEGKILSLSVEK